MEMNSVQLSPGKTVHLVRGCPGTGFLDGFREARASGLRLATNAEIFLLKKLMAEDLRGVRDFRYRERELAARQKMASAFPAFGSLYAKPEDGKGLKKRGDVVESETGWGIPGSSLKKAEGKDPYAPGVVLEILFDGFERRSNQVVFIPSRIVVVENAQESDKKGVVDEATGMVVRPKDGLERIDPMRVAIAKYPKGVAVRFSVPSYSESIKFPIQDTGSFKEMVLLGFVFGRMNLDSKLGVLGVKETSA